MKEEKYYHIVFMLTKEQKKQLVKDLRKKIKENKLTVFCNFERIPIARQRELKAEFQKIRGKILVVKRRLLQRAANEEGIQFPEITGPVMMGFATEEILPAKIFKKFPRKKEKLEFIGGILREDKKYTVLDKEDLEEVANLPTKEEIFVRLLRVLQSPMSNLYFALSQNIQKFNYILANLREQ